MKRGAANRHFNFRLLILRRRSGEFRPRDQHLFAVAKHIP
jgi:hypothetical protein